MRPAPSASNRQKENKTYSRRKLLVVTLGVFIILSALWIWIRLPAGTPPGSSLNSRPFWPRGQKGLGFRLGSNYKTLQTRRPLQPARSRSNRPKLNRSKLESTKRNQQVFTNYSKLSITYERAESDCSGVFISVRTTVKFHKSRLLLLLHTWLQTVDPKQVADLIKITKSNSNLLNFVLQVQIITDFVNDSTMDPAIDAAKAAGMLPIER